MIAHCIHRNSSLPNGFVVSSGPIAGRAPLFLSSAPSVLNPKTDLHLDPERPPVFAGVVEDQKRITDAFTDADANRSWLQRWCLKAIEWYQQRTRREDGKGGTRNILGCVCPYYPSCSTYTAEAIREYGVLGGILRGAKRIFLKCNPCNLWFNHKAFELKPNMIFDPVRPTDPMPDFMKPQAEQASKPANLEAGVDVPSLEQTEMVTEPVTAQPKPMADNHTHRIFNPFALGAVSSPLSYAAMPWGGYYTGYTHPSFMSYGAHGMPYSSPYAHAYATTYPYAA